MAVLKVDLGDRGYQIVAGSGILEELGSMMAPMKLSRKLLLVSNSEILRLYGQTVIDSLQRSGFDVMQAPVPDGETAKTFEQVQHLFDLAVEHNMDRRSPVVALGGGVVGDLAGFMAATYMRGVPFVQVPTTLLAQVDSSVGGKVAVNHPGGKNLIGAFYQPRLVLADLNALHTLPVRELRAGMAEVIKYGVIRDAEFFSFLETNMDTILRLETAAVEQVVLKSCAIKAVVVETDETEQGVRAILNYGHTVGHAVENLTGYGTYLHGEAVAIGMVAAADAAVRLGCFSREERDRVAQLIRAAGLPAELPAGLTWEGVIRAAAHDKKTVDGRLTMILPETVGKVRMHSITPSELLAVWH